MEREKHYFASANTGEGFICHFDSINNKSEPYFQFIIKGGSGSGKSTLMKKIAQHFLAKGEKVEYFYCSSDPQSLDAVRIVDRNISLIDGTAPHITEASFPGVTSEIFDVGKFVKPSIKKYKNSILKNSQKKLECYNKAYKLLSGAKIVLDVGDSLEGTEIDNSRIIKTRNSILKNISLKKGKCHIERQLFLESFSNEGFVDVTTKNFYKKIVKFECLNGEVQFIFKSILQKLESEKIEIIKFYNFLNPNKISALEINNILIIPKIIEKNNKKIEKNNILIKKILNNSKNYFLEAKKWHKKIEEVYSKNMDFKELDTAVSRLIERIETM